MVERSKHEKNNCFLLAAVMVFMPVSFAFADDARSSAEKEKLNSAVERIQEEIPAAEIRVVEGVIHVVVEDFLDIPGTVVCRKMSKRSQLVL